MNTPSLKIAVFADTAHKETILKRYLNRSVQGFTTNPSLLAKAGVKDYTGFARSILSQIQDLPISFEVFSDTLQEMKREAHIISSWGGNVNVKIPISNTKGTSTLGLIRELLEEGLKLNVTALCTQSQLKALHAVLKPQDDVIVSIFAGRIADTGVDPKPLMRQAVKDYQDLPLAKILWASSRETLNIYQAQECGCQVITATEEQLNKLSLFGKPLEDLSLEAIQSFYHDAREAGLKL